MGREAVAGLVTIASAFIAASIVYQIVKPRSQGPAVIKSVTDATTQLGGLLFSNA